MIKNKGAKINKITKKEKELIVNIKKIVKKAGGGQKEYKQIVWAGVEALKKTLKEISMKGGKMAKRIEEEIKGYKDRYGRIWNLPKKELCKICGQPDSTGDCNHKKLSGQEVVFLKGAR